MGIFDPATFMDQGINDANSTVTVPVPAGEYVAVASLPVIREWTSKDGTKSGIAVDINWAIDDAGVKAELGRDKVVAKQGIMLDLNAAGAIDTGKGMNVALGRLREALGLNTPGQPFSFRQVEGQVAKIRVEHRIDGEQTFADVKGVTRVS